MECVGGWDLVSWRLVDWAVGSTQADILGDLVLSVSNGNDVEVVLLLPDGVEQFGGEGVVSERLMCVCAVVKGL